MLGWTPAAFWAATPAEFHAALDGWREAHGAEPAVEPMTRAEAEALFAEYT